MVAVGDLLGSGGPLARALPGYEERSGQLTMALAVERALAEERVVLCEAGTGTGKTLAYLLPALLSGRKVIVSTATRALQEQIFFKDIPLVARAFGLEPRVALMKGIGNYLCRRRHAEVLASPEALVPEVSRRLRVVGSWLERTESGDLGELEDLAEDDPLRQEIASSSDTRIGSGCPHFEDCFVTRMKREAEAAQLVVVNHHLFFADLALRGPHPAHVLPDYDAVVFDEAHQIEDIATEFFSVRVSSVRIDRLLHDVTRLLGRTKAGPLFDPGAERIVDAARVAARDFWKEVLGMRGSDESRVAVEQDAWVGARRDALHRLDSALEGVEALAATLANRTRDGARGGTDEALFLSERRAGQLREQLTAVSEAGRGRVVWLDVSQRRVTLSSSPVDLSVLLRERIFEPVPAVVLTSATLATESGSATRSNGPFSYLRTRLGLGPDFARAEELVVSSPFAFERQALLYTPHDLPAPGTPAFWDAAAARVLELVTITGGGAFVLSTSLRAMRELHKRLARSLPSPLLMMQGDAPKAALIRRFRDAEDAVLVATMGFWEGVDVPGRALRLVVLEKVPFPVPSDPIVAARGRVLEEAGENPFMKLFVPAAALALKQGFGRLIRSQRDFGVVALLDERVHRRGYGSRLLSALPPARRTESLDEVRAFWAGHVPAEACGVAGDSRVV